MKYLLENEETARLHFRKIRSSDFDPWLDFFKDPTSFEHWNAPCAEPTVECRRWFARQAERYANQEGGFNALIEKTTGALIGYSGLLVQVVDGKTEFEVAYSLLFPYRKQGFALEAAIKCRNVAFENKFADSLISIISLTNVPSAKVAIKNGMSLEKQTMYKENRVSSGSTNQIGGN